MLEPVVAIAVEDRALERRGEGRVGGHGEREHGAEDT